MHSHSDNYFTLVAYGLYWRERFSAVLILLKWRDTGGAGPSKYLESWHGTSKVPVVPCCNWRTTIITATIGDSREVPHSSEGSRGCQMATTIGGRDVREQPQHFWKWDGPFNFQGQFHMGRSTNSLDHINFKWRCGSHQRPNRMNL